MPQSVVLVTGATGMVGNYMVRRLLEIGYQVRVMVRPASDTRSLKGLAVQRVEGDLTRPETLQTPLLGVDYVVHAAAHVGDWGPVENYRAINVFALEHLLTAAERAGRIRRWIQISSLGVYQARHHFGTDETVDIGIKGLDGYTQTKVEAEWLLQQHMDRQKLPIVIVRPGFIYGPGDRHVVPRLLERISKGKMKMIGDGHCLLNNTYVGNLVDAVLLSMEKDIAIGEIFNVRDDRLVTRVEFIGTIADYMGKPCPGTIPEWLARALARSMEGMARLAGASESPLLTQARIKFLTLNLDFSIAKAKRLLGYQPRFDFQDGIRETFTVPTILNQPMQREAA